MTGATGQVGVEVVRALLSLGVPVRAGVTDPARAAVALASALGPAYDPGAVELCRFDFLDARAAPHAFDGARSLFLLRPPAISDARVIDLAVDAAIAAGVRHVVFLSVQGAAHNPLVPHHAIETHLDRLVAGTPGLRASILRAAFFMQNLSTTHAAEIRERSEIFVPAGRGRTAFVDVRDLGAAAARLLAEAAGPSAAYECTGREALTYAEVATVLSAELGRRVTYTRPSALRFYREMRRRGVARGYAGVMVALYSAAALGRAAHLSDDLAGLLGREPIGFAGFVHDYAAEWR